MKNVTITLPDGVLARARIEAAKQSKSLSRFVADLVEKRCAVSEDPAEALRRFLSGPGVPGASKDLREARGAICRAGGRAGSQCSTKAHGMKNVTITLDEDLAAWARIEAAKENKSLSRYLGDLLALQRLRTGRDELSGLRAWLDHPGWQSVEQSQVSRSRRYEEDYDRLGFPGYERRPLHD